MQTPTEAAQAKPSRPAWSARGRPGSSRRRRESGTSTSDRVRDRRLRRGPSAPVAAWPIAIPRSDDVFHRLVGGEFPAHLDLLARHSALGLERPRCEPGPEHSAGARRVARGNAERKRVGVESESANRPACPRVRPSHGMAKMPPREPGIAVDRQSPRFEAPLRMIEKLVMVKLLAKGGRLAST